MPFGLSAAPGHAQTGTDRDRVVLEAGGEALDDPHAAGTGVGQPGIEGGDEAGLRLRAAAASENDPAEPPAEVDDIRNLVILQHAPDRSGGLGIEIIRLAQEVPR